MFRDTVPLVWHYYLPLFIVSRHTYDCTNVWGVSTPAKLKHTHWKNSSPGTIRTANRVKFSFKLPSSNLFKHKKKTKPSDKYPNDYDWGRHEYSRLLKVTTCGLRCLGEFELGALWLPCWVHFPLNQEAMSMAFTHQRSQKSATYQAAWNSDSKINNVFFKGRFRGWRFMFTAQQWKQNLSCIVRATLLLCICLFLWALWVSFLEQK